MKSAVSSATIFFVWLTVVAPFAFRSSVKLSECSESVRVAGGERPGEAVAAMLRNAVDPDPAGLRLDVIPETSLEVFSTMSLLITQWFPPPPPAPRKCWR